MIYRALTVFALTATLFLGACADAEEKAEEFYQSGLALLAEGDINRAAIEFRNVLEFDPEHQEARLELAAILEAQDDPSGAYNQYRYVAERNPEFAPPLQAMGRIAILLGNWEEAERHGRRAITLDPDAPVSQSIQVSLDYRQAVTEDDSPRQEALAADALRLLEADATDLMSRRVVITHEMRVNRPSAALEYIDPAIAQAPEELAYYVIKLQALSALQEEAAVEELLRQMYTQFPENSTVQQSLINLYMRRDDNENAETFLRELAGDETGDPANYMTVLQFIEQTQGPEAAIAELERMIEVNAELPENHDFYRTLRAGYTFQQGETDAAIAELQDILSDAEASERTRWIKTRLSEMLLRTGNRVGGRALLEEVLAEDATNVEALKQRARLLIDGDEPDAAIIDLRSALDQTPRDVEILLLLAKAHERNGNTNLQGERLATAVEVSNAGVQESLLYARYLVRNDRLAAARTVLADARNANPNNLDILALAAELALADNALGLVRGIIADVERLQDQPGAPALLKALRTNLLLSEDRIEEGLAILQEEAGTQGENPAAVYSLIQTQLQNGRLEEARSYLDQVLTRNPDDFQLRMINAALYVAEGDTETSEGILRDLVAEDPGSEAANSQLYIQLMQTGKQQEARTVLTAALAATNNAPRLLMFEAGALESEGDVEGAIAIYENLYSLNTNNVAIANNLASLLSTFRSDEESLARAAVVARRLRDTEIPAFQDTYGWIAYQQGDFEEALSYLEPAAASLTDNPLVQYHLGMTYAALQRPEDAQTTLTRAIEIAGPNTTLPQMQVARETLDSLQAN